jgi:peptide/nickel transport system substrate-binding protein
MTGSPFKRIGVSVLAVAALSLTACGSAASSGASGSGASGSGASGSGASGSGTPSQTLTIGYDSDPALQGYDPLLYAGGQRLFYEPLYQSLFVQTAASRRSSSPASATTPRRPR